MARVVIVGAGYGGIVACHSLLKRLPEQHEIVLITEDKPFFMKAAFPMVAFNEVQIEEIALSIRNIFHNKRVHLIMDKVIYIDPQKGVINTEHQICEYDYLVLAVGTRYAFEKIGGFQEFGQSVKTVKQLTKLRQSIQNFQGGTIVIGALDSPCEGPAFEMIFKFHHYLRKRGLLGKSEIHFFTDKPDIFEAGGPNAQAYVKEQLFKRNIYTHTGVHVNELQEQSAHFSNGMVLNGDIIMLIPPYEAPSLLAHSGLAGEKGYISVDNELRSKKFHNIYATGDAIALKGPKMAHNAMNGAKVIAKNISNDLTLSSHRVSFQPEVVCVMDMGGRDGTFIEADTEWGGNRSRVPVTGPIAKFMKESFISYFIRTKGDVKYIL